MLRHKIKNKKPACLVNLGMSKPEIFVRLYIKLNFLPLNVAINITAK